VFLESLDGGELRFLEEVKGGREEDGGGSALRHFDDGVFGGVFDVVGREGTEFGGESGTFEVGELVGVEPDRDVSVIGGSEELSGLIRGESDRFGKAVDVIDQIFFDGGGENFVDNVVDVFIFGGEFGRKGVGGEEALCDSDFQFARE